MEELRSILLDLQLKLNSIIDRIPEEKDVGNLSTSVSAASQGVLTGAPPCPAW
jgi:hypothetical protein